MRVSHSKAASTWQSARVIASLTLPETLRGSARELTLRRENDLAALMRLLTDDLIIASSGDQADAFSRPPLAGPLRQHRVEPAAGSSRRGSVT